MSTPYTPRFANQQRTNPNLSFSTERFCFRSLGKSVIENLITKLKREYPITKHFIENDEGYLYLNIVISGYGAKEDIEEIEKDEESLIFGANDMTLSPYHNDVVDLSKDDSLEKYYEKNELWEKKQILFSIKKGDKEINKKVSSLKKEDIKNIFYGKKRY